MRDIHHALVLNPHQPAGNLQELLDHHPWETQEILDALDRIPRSLWGYEDLARVHLSLSGIYWGEAWVGRVHRDLDASQSWLGQARQRMGE